MERPETIVISEFLDSIRDACTALERAQPSNLQALLPKLTHVLYAAEMLRQCTLQVERDSLPELPREPPSIAGINERETFYIVFDPLDAESVVQTTLRDCLDDVYKSLKRGIELLSHHPDRAMEIVWELRMEYVFHWGRHLVDAIRYIFLTYQ